MTLQAQGRYFVFHSIFNEGTGTQFGETDVICNDGQFEAVEEFSGVSQPSFPVPLDVVGDKVNLPCWTNCIKI